LKQDSAFIIHRISAMFDRRTALAIAALGTLGSGPLSADTADAESAANRKPNFVIILVDDWGWRDAGCYGSTLYETPHIDRMAAAGMRFTDAYAACPVCSPTRASLMTGRTPARVGFTGHITATGKHRYPSEGAIIPPDDHLNLPLSEKTIAAVLRSAGYTSASIGKWHLGVEDFWPERHGFDLNVAGTTHGSPPGYFWPYTDPKKAWNPRIPTLSGGQEGEYLTHRLTDEAVRFIEAHRQEPFFCYLSHYAVHTPLEAPEPLVVKYRKKLETDRSQKNPVYAAMVETIDRSVGRVVEALERLGLAEDTLIILTSDNGGLADVTVNAPLRAGKGFLYEGGIRVPLLACWPGRIKAGGVCDEPVSSYDILPTLAALAGVPVDDLALDGVSLAELLTGKRRTLGREELTWYYPHYSPQSRQPGAAIRSGRYKLIEHYDPPGVELYDLNHDLGEQRDLAGLMPEKAEQLRLRLHAYLRSAGTIMHQPNPKTRTATHGR
jgi:arylsulfatase A